MTTLQEWELGFYNKVVSECREAFLSTIVISVFSGCHSRLLAVIPEGESAFVLVVPDLLHHLKSASNIMGSATSLLEHGHPIVIERHLRNLSSLEHIRHTSRQLDGLRLGAIVRQDKHLLAPS